MRNDGLKYSKPIIDGHAHVTPQCIDAYVDVMDEFNVEKSAVFSLNVLWSNWRRTGEGVAALVKYLKPERFILVTTVDIKERNKSNFGEREAARIEECVENGSQGVKTFFSGNAGSWYQTGLTINDERMDPIYEKCAELGIPIIVHFNYRENSRLVQRHLFSEDGPFYDASIPSVEERMIAFERKIWNQFDETLKKHRETNFISCHMMGRPSDPEFISHWLKKHPNLYVDTSALTALRVFVASRDPDHSHFGLPSSTSTPKTFFNDRIVSKARSFFIEFSDRIVFGTDMVVWGYRSYEKPVEAWRNTRLAYRDIFESDAPGCLNLPAQDLDKIYYKNANRLLAAENPLNMGYFVKNLRRDISALEDFYNNLEENNKKWDPRIWQTAPTVTTLVDKGYKLKSHIHALKEYASKIEKNIE